MWGFLVKLWEKMEIRVLVISSLSIQILLLGLAGFRKHVISYRCAQTTAATWRGPLALMFHWFLWFIYLMADYVALVALAYLPKSEDKASPQNKTQHLLMFWAPFFLLHLGGQDTITGLSVEDNDLWSRQLLTMLSQVALAIYNYSTSNLQIGALWPPAALMFVVAIFKYGERIWCLQRASMSAMRKSMTPKPHPGPNYVKLMEVYTSYNFAGLGGFIKVNNQKPSKGGQQRQRTEESAQRNSLKFAKILDPTYDEIVYEAYKFFPTFKRLFVDLILSFKNREDSQKYFSRLQFEDAYKLIEIELSWMYDILHSKCSVIYAIKHYGWVSRVITLLITSVALCLFAMSDQTGYGRFETTVTYVLLGGAVGLEILALVFMLLSFWTYATMKESGSCCGLSDFLFSIQQKLRPPTKPRWSDKMAQLSLITYSLEDQPSWLMHIMKWVGLNEIWDHYLYTTYVTVNKDLKDLVFKELKEKMIDTGPKGGFTAHRGQHAMLRMGYYDEFGWSVDGDFDESILIWHIVTDLLYYDHKMSVSQPVSQRESEQKPYYDHKMSVSQLVSQWESEQKPKQHPEPEPEPEPERDTSQHISNYMLFLLIERPFMMPAGIGPIRFGDTCAEATIFLQQVGDTETGIVNKDNIKKSNVERGDIDTDKCRVERSDIEMGIVKKGNTKDGNDKKCKAVRSILKVNTDYDPRIVKGERSNSVFFRGCMLAHDLKKEFNITYSGNCKPNWNKLWKFISSVWVEMLCYAASKCSGQIHAKQLSKGGELLTVVWFLMAHLGMGERYQNDKNNRLGELIITK